MKIKSKKIAILALLIALAMMLSYLESILLITSSIPALKIGLPNIVIIFILYKFGFKEAFVINISRILLTGLLFTNIFSVIYSISGGVLSLIVMYFLKKSDDFSVCGCSVAGAVTHNVAQIIVAGILIHNSKVVLYLPVLLLFATVSGIIVGLVSAYILNRSDKFVIND